MASHDSGFIKSMLPKFAAANPSIEFSVSQRPRRHPCINAHYINGHQRSISCRSLEPAQILEKAEILRNASGEKNKRVNKPVKSSNPSVRGIWSPYHGKGLVV